jgi:hypothetical protein
MSHTLTELIYSLVCLFDILAFVSNQDAARNSVCCKTPQAVLQQITKKLAECALQLQNFDVGPTGFDVASGLTARHPR